MKKVFVTIAKICTVIFGMFFLALSTGEKIMLENVTMMNNTFKQSSQVIVDKESDEEVDTEYFKSSFNSVKEVVANSEKVSQAVVTEGATLLKNDNNALPIPSGSKVSLFSISSISTSYGGGGSSATRAGVVSMKAALNDVGLTINDDLWDWYTANKSTYLRTHVGGIGIKYSINDAGWDDIPSDIRSKNARDAIFVLSRLGTENEDLTVNTGDPTDMTNGSYLMLSPKEKTVLKGLKQLKEQGVFEHIIVLLNSPNQVETNFVDDTEYGIDALLWCGSFGTMGPRAVADLFVGKYSPSGRLSDIYWKEHRFNPVMANFLTMGSDNASQTAYYYSGTASTGETLDAVRYYYGGVQGCPYVVYQEGIYNGYRYAETRYEDVVMNRQHVGEFNYSDVISYPFGYGLSYTTFSYSDFKVTYNEQLDVFNVSVKVTNTGNVAGKEVVQVYLQKPYTQYDIDHNIEKSAVELVGFKKTKLLDKNASEVINIEVDKEYFASYDAWGEKTYILDAGDYYLTAAKDSHDAINNILKYKSESNLDINSSKMSYFENNSGDNGKNLVYHHVEDTFDGVTYSYTDDPIKSGYKSESDGLTKITNQFDSADLNIYENAGEENRVKYITRNNWEGTVKFGLDKNNNYLDNYVHLSWNPNMEYDHFETAFNNAETLVDDVAYPTMNSGASSWSLIDMMKKADGTDVSYSHEIWEQLLDQLSWDDMVKLLSAAFRHTEAVGSIAKPATIDHNGAVGVVCYFDEGAYNNGLAVRTNDPDKHLTPPAYPCNGIVASTFNVELIKEYGEAWGEDALWAGYSGLFGPGINGHRAPYAGRTFEYYSEDPFLAGKICSPLCRGMKEKGIYVYLKHACLNEQETKRTTLATWANEQTIRENYLRAFEIAIEEGGADCVMLGLNKIGPFETALTNLCNGVLRNEFGMKGHVITDYITDAKRFMMPYAHVMGTDLPDRDFNMYNYYDAYRTNHGRIAWAMRESVHHVLYTIVHSAAMNGMSSNTLIYTVTPQWQTLVRFGVSSLLILFILSILMLVTLYAFPFVPDQVKRFANKEKRNDVDLTSINDLSNKKVYFKKKDPWYGHLVRGTIGLGAIILLSVEAVAAGTKINETESIISLANSTADGYINETVGGDNVASHFFEAESAEFTGVSCYGEDQGKPFEKKAGLSYIFGDFHGGMALTNIYTPTSYETPNELKFVFNSDKKVKCKMRIGLSAFRNIYGTISTRYLSEYYDIEVNGNILKTTVEVDKSKVIKTVEVANNFYPVTYADVTVKLEEGANTIKLICKSATGAYSTPVLLDYIDVRTSASLTDYTNYYWDLDGIVLDKAPSFWSQGLISCAGVYQTIPSLKDGTLNGIYSTEDTSEYRKYYIGNSDILAYEINKNPHILRIHSPYACFADESREATLIATDPLPEGIVHVSPVGMIFKGWTYYDNPNSTFTPEEFVMLDADVDIAPYFDAIDKVSKLEPDFLEDVFKKVDISGQMSDYNINTSNPAATYGFDNKKLLSKLSSSVIINDDVAEVASLYNYDKVPEAGSKFAIHNSIPLKGTNTIKYLVQNQGVEELDIDIARTKSSGDAFALSNPQKHFVLAPGEKISFTLTQNGSHDTLITGVRINNTTVGEFKLAMTQYIAYGEHGSEEQGDVFVRLKGDVMFADGSTYKMLAAGSTLPDVVLTGDSIGKEDTFLGWLDKDGNSYAKSSFVVPEDDITLYPLFTQETVRTGYGKLLLGSGNQGADQFAPEGGFIGAYSVSAYKTGNTFIGSEYALTMGLRTPTNPSTDPTETGSGFRMLTGYTSPQGNTKYTYTFRNDGNKTLSFSVYHRFSSSDKSEVSSIDFVLAPGEIATKSLIRAYTSNNNLITHFKFNDDNYANQQLSMYCYAGPDGETAQVNLTGATFSSGASSSLVKIGNHLPTIETEGVVGVKDENGVCYTLNEYVVPEEKTIVNLTALFDELINTGSGKVDLFNNLFLDSYSVYAAKNNPDDAYIGNERAIVLKMVSSASGTDNTGTGASFRFRFGYNNPGSEKTTNLAWTFKNLGTGTLSFNVYQRASGSDTSQTTFYPVEISPGEVATVNIVWNAKISTNGLTYIRFSNDNWQNQKIAAYCYITAQ